MLRLDTLPLRYHQYGGYSPSGSGYYGYRGVGGGDSGLGEYFRRILDYQQMDFEAAFEDITMLCSTNPERV
jgi:hypothetical protein